MHNRFLLLPTATGVDTYQHPSGWKPSVRDRQTAFLLVPEGVQLLHLLNLSQGLGSFGRTPLVDFRRFLSFTFMSSSWDLDGPTHPHKKDRCIDAVLGPLLEVLGF